LDVLVASASLRSAWGQKPGASTAALGRRNTFVRVVKPERIGLIATLDPLVRRTRTIRQDLAG
jgi:hypothetical protein